MFNIDKYDNVFTIICDDILENLEPVFHNNKKIDNMVVKKTNFDLDHNWIPRVKIDLIIETQQDSYCISFMKTFNENKIYYTSRFFCIRVYEEKTFRKEYGL